MKYQRLRIPGGTYFFTVVTHQRRPLLCTPMNIKLLREAFDHVITIHPFKIDAIVILPDHIHSIFTLPKDNSDYPTRWRLIKSYFSHRLKLPNQTELSIKRKLKHKKPIWQRRYWEHLIRNERDLERHVEYIHYNPLKHGLVKAPKGWKHSSYHKYVKDGLYGIDWGSGELLVIDGINE